MALNANAAPNSPDSTPDGSLVPVEELIYTSAPKLLTASAAHLGVVARSRAFLPEIEAAVSKQWSYTMPAALGLPESQTLPRFCLLPVSSHGRWITLSRVQSAGFDHTGRTSPIAHHFAVDTAALGAGGGSVASLVGWASRHYVSESERVFNDRWDEDPRELPSRQIGLAVPTSPEALLRNIPPTVGVGAADIRQACLKAAETLLAYPASQQMAVVIIRPAFAPYVLSFLGAVLAALPKSVQLGVNAISHVWEVSDAPGGYSLAFTYPRSPYSERVKERADSKKPVIIDLALKVPAVPVATGEYISLIQSDWDNWTDPGRWILPQLFDAVDPQCERSTEVFAVKRALDAWRENLSYFSLDAVVQAGGAAVRAGASQRGIDSLLTHVGLSSVERFVGAEEWSTVFETAVATTFPKPVRDRAWDAIRDKFSTILGSEPELIAQRTCEADGERVVALLAETDHAIETVLRKTNARVAGRPPADTQRIAARWATLGTKILSRAWQLLSLQVAGEGTPSAFYRLILDQVMPRAVIPADGSAGAVGASPKRPPPLGLENVMRPAWTLVSWQLAGNSPPEPVCLSILDCLASRAVVTGADSRPVGEQTTPADADTILLEPISLDPM